MISLPELRAKALRQYVPVLRAHLAGEDLFPLVLRVDKSLDRSRGAAHIYAQQETLLVASKNRTGLGYTLTLKPNLKTGQSEITRIAFDELADFLWFIDKQAEHETFVTNAARTAAELPELLPLLHQSPRLLLDYAADWAGLLAVCAYFRQHPQPTLYVRSLPLALPTKFVEQHQTALRTLLDYLIADHVRAEETDFFRRFHLLLEEPSIKLRFLDAALRLHPTVSQMSVWVSEFRQLNLAVRRVYVIENLTSFLAFPLVEGAVAIWGGGFAVSLLAEANWLHKTQLFYWGDIDVHGFQILARLRAHFPATQSLLMDEGTFRQFYINKKGGKFHYQYLPDLTIIEQNLYQMLLKTNARVEQEQLPLQHVTYAVQVEETNGT